MVKQIYHMHYFASYKHSGREWRQVERPGVDNLIGFAAICGTKADVHENQHEERPHYKFCFRLFFTTVMYLYFLYFIYIF